MNSKRLFVNDVLVTSYLEFCADVESVLTASEGEARAVNPNERGEALRGELCDLVARAESTLMSRPDASQLSAAIPRFKYLLAAWADERMLRQGSEAGVERALFGTAHAGEQLFDDIELSLQRRWPVDQLLAAPYLLALSLGFVGRHLSEPDPEQVHRLHGALEEFACTAAPFEDRDLAATAAAQWVRPPNRGRWIAACSAVWVIGFVIASWAWMGATDPLNNWLDRAESGPNTLLILEECR
ncbi:DotU family type IV/VI secretion system protein [Piscinibacter sp.]|uniref:DotU family type IV/VI secretion system protein n=1 Tax=Piscinibacter sp. TaxID=1903157 RepID=UPI002CD8E5FE|nr:DotU family type IV/VI secretion system protein [Albitalea sp.]HUG22188.1 DotU family type IV/VI secretion system protein [Albitalea sp.]